MSNVVNLFDVMPSGAAQDPNDPITVAAGGTLIKAGAPKALVQKLQLLLASWGFSPGTADGVYGKNTAVAVRGLQAKLDLDADGVFGPETARAVQDDLARGVGSVLRANKAMFSPPALPPASTAQPTPAAQPGSAPLPATQPARASIPWWIWLGGAAAVLFLVTRTREEEDAPLAPRGSVVADLGDEDDFVVEEEVVEEPPPKPKKLRKPRKKKTATVEGVVTPDEVLPPEDNAVDVEFHEVPETPGE